MQKNGQVRCRQSATGKSGLKSRATDHDIKSETVIKNSDTVRGMRRYDADISGMEFMSHSWIVVWAVPLYTQIISKTHAHDQISVYTGNALRT